MGSQFSQPSWKDEINTLEELETQMIKLSDQMGRELTYKVTTTERRHDHACTAFHEKLTKLRRRDSVAITNWENVPERIARLEKDRKDSLEYGQRLAFAMAWGGGGSDD